MTQGTIGAAEKRRRVLGQRGKRGKRKGAHPVSAEDGKVRGSDGGDGVDVEVAGAESNSLTALWGSATRFEEARR